MRSLFTKTTLFAQITSGVRAAHAGKALEAASTAVSTSCSYIVDRRKFVKDTNRKLPETLNLEGLPKHCRLQGCSWGMLYHDMMRLLLCEWKGGRWSEKIILENARQLWVFSDKGKGAGKLSKKDQNAKYFQDTRKATLE